MNQFKEIEIKKADYLLHFIKDINNNISVNKTFFKNINYLEIDILSRLDSPHILYQENLLFDKENNLIITLPLINIKLKSVYHKLYLREKMLILYKIARTLAFLHSNNIIYNNLTIDNIYLYDENIPLLIDLDFVYYSEDISDKKKDILAYNDLWHLLIKDERIPYFSSFSELASHIIFLQYRGHITQEIRQICTTYNIGVECREMLKYIYNLYENCYKESYVIVLFLAIDLYLRCLEYYRYYDKNKLVLISSSCLYLAATTLHNYSKNNKDLLITIYEIAKITVDISMINKIVNDLILLFHGCINYNTLYNLCDNKLQLRETFNNIIFSKTISNYGHIDLIAWKTYLDEKYPYVESKLITYQDLIAQ